MATLSEMAQIVTTELGVFDDTSILLTKVALSEAYSTLWDRYPWSDTEIRISLTLPAGSAAYPMPATINRPIAIRARNIMSGEIDVPTFRADARMIEPVTSKFLIESDPQLFEQGGYLKYYEEWTNPLDNTKALRFYPTPVVDTELGIVAKAVCPGFSADADVSIIRNIDVCLIAYATASMLRRQRQYGKADLQYKRAQELEATAWNLEQQQVNQPRMTKATTVAGNSLAEMTDAVCTICGQWTPEYRLIIREFLRRNYQTMYDMFLWPESLVMVRVQYTTEQVIMPEYIDKVLGVRGASNLRMFPADAGLFLDVSPSIFDEIGDPIGYTTLTPVGVSTLPSTTTKLVIASTSAVDTSWVAVRGEILSTGTQLEEQIQLNGTTPVTSFYSYDIPITVAKDITIGDVTVNAASDMRLLVQLLPYQRESKHQRLWFLPAPQQSAGSDFGSPDAPVPTVFTCLVLGKRAIRPLLSDQDTPIITGAQQVLIAAAAGDLFRKLEKHDMANAMLQKASAATDVLKAKNTDQAASSPRFVPQVEAYAYVAGITW